MAKFEYFAEFLTAFNPESEGVAMNKDNAWKNLVEEAVLIAMPWLAMGISASILSISSHVDHGSSGSGV